LGAELAQKKRDWEIYWLNLHPKDRKYSFVDQFTTKFISSYASGHDTKILELGPGPNSAARYLEVDPKNYHAVERSPEFCAALAEIIPQENIHQQDIIKDLSLAPAAFDRIIAAHVLEHILDLPPVLKRLRQLLRPGGHLDIVLPCEAGVLYTIGRKFSSEREFKKKFGRGFAEIMRSDHVNTVFEVFDELQRYFKLIESTCFPLPINAFKLGFHFNLLVGMRLT
jgi:SAM-dependent methyltransferase